MKVLVEIRHTVPISLDRTIPTQVHLLGISRALNMTHNIGWSWFSFN